MAANQRRSPIVLGFTPATPNQSTSTLALNNSPSNLMMAMGFRLDQAKTLSKVQLYCTAVQNGASIGANDLTCDIYSNSGGKPNVSLQSSNTLTSTIAAAWVEWTGFTYSLAASTQYWLVWKNNNASATANYPTYQYGYTGTLPAHANGNTAALGWNYYAFNGTTWATPIAAACGVRLQFSDGTYDGFPVQSIPVGTDRAYNTNEVGVQFTMPSGPQYNVRGLSFCIEPYGSPTGNLLYRIYKSISGTMTLLATSNGVSNTDAINVTYGYVPDYFSSDVTLGPGDTVICTMANSATTDTNAKSYEMAAEYKFANDANTLALLPMGATLQKAVSSNAGGASTPTFTLTNTSIFPFALLLDTAGAFASSGGGGVIVPRPMLGGYNS